MLLKHYFSVMCIGLAHLNLPVGLAIAAPKNNLVALTLPQIQAQMARFVVRIDGEGKGNGSGFIINKNGNTYTVLTNEHVIRNSTRQSITTPDGRKYSFTTTDIKILPDLDLAEITFVSTQTYEVAKLSAQGKIGLGNSVYVYGWNAVSKPIYQDRQPRFAPGVLSQTLSIKGSYKGYTLVFSGLPPVPGLSGSPVLNENGEVIGIYGLTDEEISSSTLGISIATYQLNAGTARVSHQNMVTKVAISPDSQTIVSGSSSGTTIKVWRLSDGQLLRTLKGHRSFVNSVAISPDGQTLFSGSYDNTVRVWRLSDGQLLRTLSGDGKVAISPDGQTLAEFGNVVNSDIKVRRLSDGRLLRTLNHRGIVVKFLGVNSVAISPDGQTLVSGSYDDTIKVWRLSDGQLLRTLSGHQGSIHSVAITPDGQTLIGGSDDKTIKVWRLSDGQLLRTLSGHQGSIHSVAITPDGQTLIGGSDDKTIKVWRLSDGQLLRTLSGHQGSIHSVAITPDGQTLFSGSYDDTIKVWRLSNGQLLRTLSGHQDGER